jgi:hypothetical protein
MRIGRIFCTLLMAGIIAFSAWPLYAQENINLQQLTHLIGPYDSLMITAYTVVGDYNADGYPDLAVGMGGRQRPPYYSAVYLYYGGPAFDSIPDLVFRDSSNNEAICQPNIYSEGFGGAITALGDFNDDGFDDFAVSAPGYCRDTFLEGRIFIYFGGPNPDTIPDIKIDGIRNFDDLGSFIASGDFNGDGYTDLIACAGDTHYGNRLNIFFGGDPPDTSLDWVQSFPIGGPFITDLWAGFDPNSDSYDDFAVKFSDSNNPVYLFFGGDSISHQYVGLTTNYHVLNFDLSGDGVDDFTRYLYGQGFFLYLGGAPFDTLPDYRLGRFGVFPFIYHRIGHDDKLLCDDYGYDRFIMYNIGIPPDTIPYAYLSFNFDHLILQTSPDIGDINADGAGEIAVATHQVNFNNYINIYTIATTGIEEDDQNGILPEYDNLLYCYPNPFNDEAKITYRGEVTRGDFLTFEIFNIQGQKVKDYSIRKEGKREISFIWDASGRDGSKVPSGIYFVRAFDSKRWITTKLLYIK